MFETPNVCSAARLASASQVTVRRECVVFALDFCAGRIGHHFQQLVVGSLVAQFGEVKQFLFK